MMKIKLHVSVALLLLASCGVGTGGHSAGGHSAGGHSAEAEITELSGEAIYLTNCAGCHGDDGLGGAENACLSVVSPHIGQQSDGQLYTFIAFGTGGRMPAFDDTLEQSEIILVIEHLRTLNESSTIDD